MQTVGMGLMILMFATGAAAQINTAEIAGVVKDTSGGVLPGATVTAKHPASGTVVERVTDGEGRFFLPALRIGQWDVTATMTGFEPQTVALALEIGRTLAFDFSLRVEGLAEQVTVQSTTPLLQTANAEISDVIGNREVVQMPLNGRNFLALAQLSDGVVIPPGGTRGEALQQAGPLPNVGGQRSGHNIYLLDGTKITDELFNNLVINPSVDSIEEFKIQKSMYPAEFGGKASALINVATKAGSNRFRGSLFEFNRNESFDSANYFQPAGQSIPPLRQNQFGGSLGGPVLQNRTFFFGSYEGQRMNRSLTRTSRYRQRLFAPAISRARHCLRSADDPDDRRLHTVSEQPDPGEPPRPDRHGAAAETSRFPRRTLGFKISRPSRNRTGSSTSSASGSITGCRRPTS